MLPQASVIIPHFNDLTGLKLCLTSLERCSRLDQVEIIVVNNAPSPLDAAFQKSFSNVRFLCEEKRGAAHARNTGVQHARGAILIFTDSDCEVASDFLHVALMLGKHNGVCGGAIKMKAPERPNPIQAYEQIFAFNQQHYIKEKGFSVTANLVTNINVFQKVGPFRDGLSEDYDWCQRAASIGYQTSYQPDLVVTHPCRASWSDLRKKWKRITQETYALHRLNNRPTYLWVLRAFAMPVSIAAHMPRIVVSRRLVSPVSRLAALYVLARLRLWRMGEMLRIAAVQSKAEG
ncbi:glycosyltransferase [uncultured Litoreibacter sp.]|uniref:glycosyltransferase family 2 protein n=1 Tax=uncultured Litoreibacter sp. TaxID=1392394 RepID=UPI00262AA7FE|nr:glycosyltransferase [uncultured Litoreibacter sp.]